MKRSHKIGEVCKLLDIQPYVLRYWETEFPALHPQKSQSGQRAYSEAEIEVIRRIKRLLYDEGYTIAGAKKKLESEPGAAEGIAESPLFAESPEPEGDPEAPAALDSPADERIESLQRGVAQALEEARAILLLLEPKRR
ncbi:MAG: MerR family transcriptional regulator [Thermoanaerobaculia bacterium]|nr:MerR family transcriptional regulator [Thermoanaerobaculia bacterium]